MKVNPQACIKDLVAGVCCAAPFLDPRAAAGIWLGLAILMHTQCSNARWKPVRLYASILMALSCAFFWAPDALAHALDAPLYVGASLAGVLLLWEALRIAIVIWLGSKLARSAHCCWLWAATTAIVVETWIPGIVPWRFGHALVAFPQLLQPCAWFGSSFATVMAFAGAGCLLSVSSMLPQARKVCSVAETPSSPGSHQSSYRLGGLGASALLLASAGWGVFCMWRFESQWSDAPQLRLGVVQVLPKQADSIRKAQRLSSEIAAQVDLVCWPESMGGAFPRALARQAAKLTEDPVATIPAELHPWPEANCPLLFGATTVSGSRKAPEAIYVSAMLLQPTQSHLPRIAGHYDKRHLMPFGEYLPGASWLQHFSSQKVPRSVQRVGSTAQLLCVQGKLLGVLLCYDDTMPTAARSSVQAGAQLLVSLADGSSLPGSVAVRQHRQLAQLRAIENRRTLLRCTSTGETCIIQPDGRIQARLPIRGEDTLVVDAKLCAQLTPYTRVGESLPWAGLCLLVVASIRRLGCPHQRHHEALQKPSGKD